MDQSFEAKFNELFREKITHCSKCGYAFTAEDYAGYEAFLCPHCGNEDMTNFGRIHRYLETHGSASMYQIYENTGISTREIKQYLRESRVEISENSKAFIRCEECGAEIKSGRVCIKCAKTGIKVYHNEVGSMPRNEGRMRFIGHNKNS